MKRNPSRAAVARSTGPIRAGLPSYGSCGRAGAVIDGRQLPGRGAQFNAFAGASRYDPDLADFNPAGWSGQGAITADRQVLADRIHDLARNDGWVSSSLTKYVDTLIGGGWIFISQPNARSLGIEPAAAAELASDIECFLDDVAADSDCWIHRQRTLTDGQLTALAMRHRAADGEALGVISWRDRGGPYATCYDVIDPDRLSNENGLPNTALMQDGIELEPVDGAPLAYQIRCAHPGDTFNGAEVMRWERVLRELPDVGRRQVVHAFEPTRAGERRGYPPLAPVLKKLRMLGKYDEFEVQAALINAVMAAFVTTPFDQEDAAKSLSDDTGESLSGYQQNRLSYWNDAPLRMSGAKVNFLFPGEDVKFTQPTHPNAVYDPFVRAGLRNVAAAAGQTYEQFTGDLSQVNYSSIRAGLVEVARGFNARKTHFAGQFRQPIVAALIQEGLERGAIKRPAGAPEFLAAKTAYCNGDHIGPALGWVDPLKEAQAVRERLGIGISSKRREAALQGVRFNQLVHESAQDNALQRSLGINPDIAELERGTLPEVEPTGGEPRGGEGPGSPKPGGSQGGAGGNKG